MLWVAGVGEGGRYDEASSWSVHNHINEWITNAAVCALLRWKVELSSLEPADL